MGASIGHTMFRSGFQETTEGSGQPRQQKSSRPHQQKLKLLADPEEALMNKLPAHYAPSEEGSTSIEQRIKTQRHRGESPAVAAPRRVRSPRGTPLARSRCSLLPRTHSSSSQRL